MKCTNITDKIFSQVISFNPYSDFLFSTNVFVRKKIVKSVVFNLSFECLTKLRFCRIVVLLNAVPFLYTFIQFKFSQLKMGTPSKHSFYKLRYSKTQVRIFKIKSLPPIKSNLLSFPLLLFD